MEAGRKATSSFVYPVGANVARLPVKALRSLYSPGAIKVSAVSMGLGGIISVF